MNQAGEMSPPSSMSCSSGTCEFSTPANIPTYDLVIKALELHVLTVHTRQENVQSHGPRTEKPKRPTVATGLSESDWSLFITKWDLYVRQTGIAGQQLLEELWSCMDADLEKLAFGDSTKYDNGEDLKKKIHNLAVTTLHPSLHAVNLHQMVQQQGESSKAFSTRVRATAYNCNLVKKCPNVACSETVSYIEETCFHVVLAGLADVEMRDRAVTQAMMGVITDLSSLLNFTSAEESAKLSNSKVGAIVRHYKNNDNRKCGHCGFPQHGENNKDRSTRCKAIGQSCSKCKKKNHYASVCKSKHTSASNSRVATVQDESQDAEVAGFLAALVSTTITRPDQVAPIVQDFRDKVSHRVNAFPVPHHVFDSQRRLWKKKPPSPPPTLTVSIQLDRKAYTELQLQPPQLVKKNGAGHARARQATADTGAQLTVVNVKELSNLGIKKESIFPLATKVSTVTRDSVDLIGGVFLIISSHDPGTKRVKRSRQLCYVSVSVPGIYLSNDACIDLGCVPSSFPSVGQCDATVCQKVNPVKCTNSGMGLNQSNQCNCPKRQLPPEEPPVLPAAPTVENLPLLREYILERFASSAFNCCEQQPLPLMDGSPPLRLFVDPEASPSAVATPASVPLHWDQEVKNGLDRDVSLGVIEKVSVNEPVKWCARMLVTPKHDGSPRRVIDYSQLNKHAPRQTHHTKSPYQIAASIPGAKVKTVLDNWHGYHSVPVAEEDRHLTTFLTPYGRYRYKTTPQGLISAGDGYTQRMDLITEGTKDYEHCVDDTILWDDSIEQNFYRVCEFIATCSRAGCIFNPAKFQFAQDTVDFLGFQITKSGVRPHKQFLETIRTFPTPKNITDVRSWFGLVNQVSYAFASAPVMEPFKKLLSTKLPFFWSEELSVAFDKSKEEVIRQCEKGVKSFELNAPTVLATDWSKSAVGCWLVQKNCNCQSRLPNCCPSGWQTVFATSKFNKPEVARYHPIEGEAYAAAWALERCRLFTLGHPNLTLAVDHRPLLAILGPNYDLGQLLNPRLMNFKLKSMAYKFTPAHVPGKKHVVPDALSRRSDSPVLSIPKPPKIAPEDSAVTSQYSDTFGPPSWVTQPQVAGIDSDTSSSWYSLPDPEPVFVATVQANLAEITGVGSQDDTHAITWDILSSACEKDADYQALHEMINSDSNEILKWPESARVYFKNRQELSTLGSIVMLQNRPVIPRSLRLRVLSHLHASHAGVNVMLQRASQTFYWPSYRKDIQDFQAKCSSCRFNAPSNPSEVNTSTPDIPPYPFHTICADFFSYAGKSYLTIVDKYSNWISIMKPTKDDSANVIKVLREFFSVYGISEVIATDGAKVFTSQEFSNFCSRWGIQQRVSSAYYAQSNKRAEVAVKSAKRIIMDNLSPSGSLNTDKFARAILQHRNAPDPQTGNSPAEIVFGHPVRDHLPRLNYVPRSTWSELATAREKAYLKRHYSKCESLNKGASNLKPLLLGQDVYIQNQTGPHPTKWGKSGTVVEVLPHSSYLIKVHGSNKVTKRNRKFLRAFTPYILKAQETTECVNLKETPDPLLQALISARDSPLFTACLYQDSQATQQEPDEIVHTQ